MTDCIRRQTSTWTLCACDSCTQRQSRIRKLYRAGAPITQERARLAQAAWEEVDRLLALGWSPLAIASACGMPHRAMTTAIDRRSMWSYGSAKRILAHDEWPTKGFIPAEASRRRLQALAAIGWSLGALTERFGVPTMTLSVIRGGKTESIQPAVAARIREMYAEAHMDPGPSARTRTLAAEDGWAPPLAWNDIDDPDETPDFGAQPSKGADLDEWLFLVRGGVDPLEASERIGVLISSILRTAERTPGREEVARLARPAAGRVRREKEKAA